ncbi:histidine phosphatase family protein [uncultured Secundilactobacillus sp.]|uniref:histidine phosphatase family protein n=1 Tax=uncultured Secundilactobacillus sp. TaxID=2813935 RepID=UPI00258CC9F8|nr:histidine phosphatase family protein [uncultured Secundilactobacillus sp.]
MTQFNVYLVRHGQTYLNKYFRIQGISDSPLTEKGIADAKHAGARLANVAFTHAYASNTSRAQDTARYILAANTGTATKAVIEPAFHEENFGYFEGNDDVQAWHMIGGPLGLRTFNDIIRAKTIEGSKDLIAAADPYGDAEDNATFWARVQPGIDRLIATHQDGDNVLVATHGTTIRSIVAKYNRDIDVAVSAINGSVTKLTVMDGHIQVDYYNNVADTL